MNVKIHLNSTGAGIDWNDFGMDIFLTVDQMSNVKTMLTREEFDKVDCLFEVLNSQLGAAADDLCVFISELSMQSGQTISLFGEDVEVTDTLADRLNEWLEMA